MKTHEVNVGARYVMKVSGKLTTVRIAAANVHGGWDAVNEKTGKQVRIKSCRRLRYAATPQDGPKPKAAATGQVSPATEAWRKDIAAKVAAPDPALDAAAEASKARGRAKKAAGRQAKAPRNLGLLGAAVQVMKAAGKPMTCDDVVKEVLAKKLWTTAGKTPGATLYSAVIREIGTKGKDARFARAKVIQTVDGKEVKVRGAFELTAAAKDA